MTKSDGTDFNFYALAGETHAPTVYKLPLDREVQQGLTVHFEALRTLFAKDAELLKYDAGYRPEANELFEVKDFKLPPELEALSPSAPPLPVLDESKLEGGVRALVGVAQAAKAKDAVFVFQSVDSRQVLQRGRWTFIMDKSVFRRVEGAGVVIRDAVDAVVQSGNLYFSSEHVVRRFLDLTLLFREATDPEVETFLDNKLFSVADRDAMAPLADQWVRRKMRLLETSGHLTKLNARKVRERARDYGLTFALKDSRLVVPADKKGLKDLLKFLDEDYLASSLTDTQFVVSSKRRLK